MIDYTPNLINGYIDIKVTNETSSKDFISIIQFIKNEKSLPKDISILVHAPDGFQNVCYKQLSSIANVYMELYQIFNNITLVIVVDKKRERTLSLAFLNLITVQPCQSKTFSSLNEAKKWLEENQ